MRSLTVYSFIQGDAQKQHLGSVLSPDSTHGEWSSQLSVSITLRADFSGQWIRPQRPFGL